MTIRYYIRNVYGQQTRYVADKETAHAVALITGRKTLTERDMRGLQALGHSFEEVLESEAAKPKDDITVVPDPADCLHIVCEWVRVAGEPEDVMACRDCHLAIRTRSGRMIMQQLQVSE